MIPVETCNKCGGQHQMLIIDNQALREWERLLGHRVVPPYATFDHDFYVDNVDQIHSIQIRAHIRDRLKHEGEKA